MKSIDPGHTYELDNVESGTQTLQFIKKEAGEGDQLVTVTDGTTNEEVLAAVIDRLTLLDEKLQSSFTRNAIAHLQAGLRNLEQRTKERVARGVEGTSEA